MKRSLLLFPFIFLALQTGAQSNWSASWISLPACQNEPNSWYCFRKDFTIKEIPDPAVAKIAIDSKYWLWINGTMVVFEGGLKRGPNSGDSYYDELDIAKYLLVGENNISVLGWYFGKDGFSHNGSGKFGFLFECIGPGLNIVSDDSWMVTQNMAYQTCPPPLPNYRLPESSIKYDATLDMGPWYSVSYEETDDWQPAEVLGIPPVSPWNSLVQRPIPFWKDFGLTSYAHQPALPAIYDRDTTLVCTLPYNAQLTPYIEVESTQGKLIEIKTDNFYGGSVPNVYAQYITRDGVQAYESYGWMNGHKVLYSIPAGVKVLDLKYRETGFDTEFAGSFTSSDPFLDKIWQKALRTLYITMRDTYMDCPDRERAQWWGDEVNESGEAFYALDTKSHSLMKKGMYELINWQRPDSTLYSPVPAGNWDKELPVQMLTSVGYYGFWNYYLHTNDLQSISDLYGGVEQYLKIWKFKEDGTVIVRHGGWSWGDWGENIDLDLLTNAFYCLALKGAANMADELGFEQDALEYRKAMKGIRDAVNASYWNGTAYRHPDYEGQTDDRSQALAVLAGIADQDKYPALLEVFKNEEHASPYMEKYVLEALFQMGYADFAIERMKKRFGDMVNNPAYTTLFEGWGIGEEGFGGGTVNHAWSGGALTLLSQYLCGIEPVKPGYELFQVIPNPGSIAEASAIVESVKGTIKSGFIQTDSKFELRVSVPSETEAIIGIPAKYTHTIKLNQETIWKKGERIENRKVESVRESEDGKLLFKVSPGDYKFAARRNP